MAQQKNGALGLDAGALAVKAAFVGLDGKLLTAYRIHHGEPEGAISDIIAEFGEPTAAAVTGSGGQRIAEATGIPYVDPAVALVAAADGIKGARHIIDIGGGSLSIVDLDAEGRFAGFRTNSLCAAGTGSFLDEQAARMKLSDEEKTKDLSIAEPPRIAARCAVFAKSDLIHRQQEGYSIPEMWSGLCRGMVATALGTLFRGRRPQGPVIISGGVALNREVLRWLGAELDAELIVPDSPESFSARGALRAAKPLAVPINWNSLKTTGNSTGIARRSKLELTQSSYPDFSCREQYLDSGGVGWDKSTSPIPSLQRRGIDETSATEVRLHADLAGDVAIGIDIGSTSTKAAVVDLEGRVVADFYRRTSGDPVGATQLILSAITNAVRGKELNIRGVGTTGSGRKMVGTIIGADRIINEITAHVRGAIATAPDVETIFEIGGQDSKFVSLRDGAPHDSNMNYVCAAGTGSFVEEQAGKLGFALTEIGDAVMGTEPPFSSDRCTVFMEQDVHALIRAGFERREVMGSVLYSVVQNYLNKVVGRRPYSKKRICFMGATARNRGLVAAFEKLVGAPIAVSPYCHVMGAYGVARIVLDEVVAAGKQTTFAGLTFANAEVKLSRDECLLCSNRCRITRALIGSDADPAAAPSWGYLCGRDPDEKSVRVNRCFDPFRKRERAWRKAIALKGPLDLPLPTSPYKGEESRCSIGLPQTLLFQSQLPLWRRFFAELGVPTVISRPTHDETLSLAADWIGSDYCYPVKLAHGHIRELSAHEGVSHIFLPYIVQGDVHDDGFERSVFCPYNIAFPSIAKEAGLSDPEDKPLIRPVINFQWPLKRIAQSISRELATAFDVDAKKMLGAWRNAREHQRALEEECLSIGSQALARLESEGGQGIVILGRPYNVYDPGSNLNLPQKIADIGITVLSAEMLPLKDIPVPDVFQNMYWKYGRKILQAAAFVAKNERLHAVYLTNFGCGPDSFLQTYVEQIMRGKPMLMLELDEHTADAGYITRLEAFRDVIRCKAERFRVLPPATRPASPETAIQAQYRTLWIPPMHPYGSPLLAAALRSVGMPAQPLPPETVESFSLAKSYCRGTECVPAPATIGAFLHVLANSDAPEKEALFMPSAKGPCRFGQYHTLHRLILDEAGYKDTHIEAWSDESGTYGTDMKTSRRLFNAILTADLLYKARCRVRPYAANRDEFDAIMQGELQRAIHATERGADIKTALCETATRLASVPRLSVKKPIVGIVGEIYVRLNPFTNGRLVETIEDAGGEAWVAPISEWLQYLAFLDKVFAREDRMGLVTLLKKTLKNTFMMHEERALTKRMLPIIKDRLEPPIKSTLAAGERFFPRRFDGESILTVGRAVEFAAQGAALIINCAPFGCMPGTLTSGIFQKLERELNVPIVSLFFDGEADLSHLVRTYMANLDVTIQEGAP
ncbi:MAG: acyl-CoA dehydratase activase [bacterium]